MCIEALGYLLLYAIKSTTTDKEDISCIHMDVILIRMLSSSLWRNIDHRSFQKFQQALLHTFTTYITGNRRIITLTCNLIYLINKDNTSFCCSNIIVGNLKQSAQDALYILTHITCFCKNSGIYNGKRNVQHLGYGSGKKSLTSTRASYHNNITLFDFHAIISLLLLQTLIMVINGN